MTMFEFTPEYKRYITSERWKILCEKYWAVFGRKCQACGKRTGKLHVHHKDYTRFGRERLSDLAGLCDECHTAVHFRHRRNRRVDLRLVTDGYIAQMRKAKRNSL